MSDRQEFDINDEFSDDIDKFRNLDTGGGFDMAPPALLELAFLSLTALVGLAWLVGLFFVPETGLDGPTWMGLGALGVVMFGLPAAAIYGLRRGGMGVVRAVVRDLVR